MERNYSSTHSSKLSIFPVLVKLSLSLVECGVWSAGSVREFKDGAANELSGALLGGWGFPGWGCQLGQASVQAPAGMGGGLPRHQSQAQAQAQAQTIDPNKNKAATRPFSSHMLPFPGSRQPRTTLDIDMSRANCHLYYNRRDVLTIDCGRPRCCVPQGIHDSLSSRPRRC